MSMKKHSKNREREMEGEGGGGKKERERKAPLINLPFFLLYPS